MKELTKGPQNKSGTFIENSDGEIAAGIEQVKKRWKEYTEGLFDDNREILEVEVTG